MPQLQAYLQTEHTSKRTLFRHVAENLRLPWEDGFQATYEAWLNRDKIAHGAPRVFARMDNLFQSFANRSRIEGGFNALLAGIFRIQGFICLSAFEDEPKEFLMRTYSHLPGSTEERSLREKLGNITLADTGL